MTDAQCILVMFSGMLAVIAYQQHFFMKQIQVLVDKAKSPSFESYTRSQEPKEKRLQLPPEPPEDLRTLQDFTI